MISNKDYVYDSSDEISSKLLESLDEFCITIPEYFLLLRVSQITPRIRSEMIRIAMTIKNKRFRVPTEDCLNNALDNMIMNGSIMETSHDQIKTITDFLNFQNISFLGYFPKQNDIDLTARGYNTLLSIRRNVFSFPDFDSYLFGLDIMYDGIDMCLKSIEQDTNVSIYARTKEMILHIPITNRSFFYDNVVEFEKMETIGAWCRRWWRIIPFGYKCQAHSRKTQEEYQEVDDYYKQHPYLNFPAPLPVTPCPCPEDLTDAETAESKRENGRY